MKFGSSVWLRRITYATVIIRHIGVLHKVKYGVLANRGRPKVNTKRIFVLSNGIAHATVLHAINSFVSSKLIAA